MKIIAKEVEDKIYNLIKRIPTITKEDIINEIESLETTIVNEVENFDVDREYYNIYKSFRESVNQQYLPIFTDILDLTARDIINNIYLSIDNTDNINIPFDKIQNASSAKRKHFEVAKQIAGNTIKMYFLNPISDKRIIDYVEEYLPDNYQKNNEINLVVWYFLVCIVSFNCDLNDK